MEQSSQEKEKVTIMVGNVVGNILRKNIAKDRYSHNMAITPEKFKQKFEKFNRGPSPTGAKFMNVVDELDDQQLAEINVAMKQRSDSGRILKPYGLDRGEPQESWLHWRTYDVEHDRKEGKRKEKNPRQ